MRLIILGSILFILSVGLTYSHEYVPKHDVGFCYEVVELEVRCVITERNKINYYVICKSQILGQHARYYDIEHYDEFLELVKDVWVECREEE